MVFRWRGSRDGSCYWDESKERELISEFSVGFEEFVDSVSDPEALYWSNDGHHNQVRTAALVRGDYYTLVFEPTSDEFGSMNKLITFWKTTPSELKKYVVRTK